MLFTGDKWWVGIVELICFAAINVLAFRYVCRKKKVADITLKIIASYFLIYKITEYSINASKGYSNMMPLDFSAVSYFLLAFSAWIPSKKLKSLTACCGVLSGAIYNVALTILPEIFVTQASSRFLFIITTINHSLLYFGAIILLSQIKLNKWDLLWLPIGVGLVISYAYFMKYVVDQNLSATSIFLIMEGKIMLYVFKDIELSWDILTLYYIGCLMVFYLYIFVLFKINLKIQQGKTHLR